MRTQKTTISMATAVPAMIAAKNPTQYECVQLVTTKPA
jgi:hypothetical protein